VDSEASIPPPPPPAPASEAAPEDSVTRAWGPNRALLGILVLLLVVTVEAAIVGAFDPNLNSLAAKLVLQALLAATLIGVSFTMAAPRGGIAPPEALGLRRPRPGAAKLAITAYLAYFAFALIYSGLVSPHQKDLTRDLGYGDGALASVIAGILIVVAAPIAEETFFRGFLFGGMRSKLSFPWAALVSALIFGAFHYTGTGSLTVLPQLMALGLVLAWLYERSGSIYPTIAVHMLNNAIAFAILTH
jgi:membrane protease YdiL (CAAX protease family)